MRYIAGIDIGNSSTEVALATVDDAGVLNIRHSALAETTGIKGTLRNVFGIQEALTQAAKAAGIQLSDISLIRINEATPVHWRCGDGNHHGNHHHRVHHDRP